MNDSPPPIVEGIQDWISNIHTKACQQGQEMTIDYTPKLGMEFENEEAAYQFYNEYARIKGFGVRREYRNVSKKDGVLTSRRFSCHKEGQRVQDKRDHLTKEPRAETRTLCNARMVISLDRKAAKYKVIDFVVEHNHTLQPPDYVHMIPSQRRISESQASQIDIAYESGLRLKASHEFFSKQAGGIESLGYTRQDHKNYLRTKRMETFRFGEVGALLKYFKSKINEDLSFFYEFQMDIEEQITNIFWADAQMINDYGYFGDAITFDTTYKTNKGYRPLGVFVGLNNHRQTVVFGAALLYDETTTSFEWLFETFIKAMGGKKPITILTDQAPAMAKAISLVMPETFHGLCTWHIRENALRHLNYLYQRNQDFSKDFEACIEHIEEENEFLCAWDELLEKHDASNDAWLPTIFSLKEKWAWAYVRKTFTAGMRSTQLSESLNADLKNHLKSDQNLVEFFTHFERVVNGKRYNESEAEFNSIDKLPRFKLKKAPMLLQAGKIYTPKIFEEFQEDYEEFQGAYIKEHKEEHQMHVYVVANVDESKDRMVWADFGEKKVACSCCKFETHGILCSHALKVLDWMNIKFIPEQYILNRWTRKARLGSTFNEVEQHKELDKKTHFTNRLRMLCPRMVRLVNRAAESHETYNFLSKVYEESAKIVEQLLAKKSCLDEESVDGCQVSVSVSIDGNTNVVQENTRVEIEGAKRNNDDAMMFNQGAKGIKQRDCSYKGKRRPKTWLEKAAKRNKTKTTKKTKKARKNSEQSQDQPQELSQEQPQDHSQVQSQVQASIEKHNMIEDAATSCYTYTQLLTVQLDDHSFSFSPSNMTHVQ